MHLLSGSVVVAGATCFIGFTVLVFFNASVAERFLSGFASSAKTHYIEQILRILVGGALVIYSSSMWQAGLFWLIGWIIVASSVGLLLIPWQWHHRLAEKLLPVLIQHMRLYAIGSLAFGIFILYAALAPHLKSAA